MFCSNCGNKLTEDDKFCMSCGTPRYDLNNNEEVEVTPEVEELEIEDSSIEEEYEELQEAEEFEPEPAAEEPDFDGTTDEEAVEEFEPTPVVEDSTFEESSYEEEYKELDEAEEFEPTPVEEPHYEEEPEPFVAPAPEEPIRRQPVQQQAPIHKTKDDTLNRTGKPKKEGKKGKGIIKWLIALIVLLVIGFFGLSYIRTERAYDKAMDDGISEMLVSDYEAAEGHFKTAMDLKPNDDEASNLYNQTLLYNEAMALFDEADYEGALEKANEATEFESSSNASKALLNKTNELIAGIEKIEQDLAKVIADQDTAKALLADGLLEDSLDMVNGLLSNPLLEDPMYKEFKDSVNTLHDEITAKMTEEAENERVHAEEERQRELAAEAESAEEVDISGKSLSDYKAIDIEYARIIEMIGYPGSSNVYATKKPAGTPIVGGIDESVVFPDAVTYLTGEYTADGMIVYSSHGNGYITLYSVPSHWHQDDQSEEGYRQYAQDILDHGTEVYVEVGNEADIISRLERTTFIK